jgi:hypothetical protein
MEDHINYGECGRKQKEVCNESLCNTVEDLNNFLSRMPQQECEICQSFAREYVIRTQTIDAMNAIDCDGFTWAENLEVVPPPPRSWYNTYAVDGGARKCNGVVVDPPCYASCAAVDPPLDTCESVEEQMYAGGCYGTCSVEEVISVVDPQCEFTADGVASLLGQPNPNIPGCGDFSMGNGDRSLTRRIALIGGIVGGAAGFMLIGGAVFMVTRNRAENHGAKKPGKDISDDRL